MSSPGPRIGPTVNSRFLPAAVAGEALRAGIEGLAGACAWSLGQSSPETLGVQSLEHELAAP